jgi:predicted RecA/RadA family phage recombinase
MSNTNGVQTLTKSMNGLIEFNDGSGVDIANGNIQCNNLTCISITADILNVLNFIVSSITATFGYITTLYVSNIRSNSANPELFSDTTYTSVQMANKCDCDIAIAGGQTGARLTIGGNVSRTSDIDIGNGTGNSCNINLSSNATATGQVSIKRFIFTLNNLTYGVISTAVNLFTTTTANIQLGKWIFNAQTLNPASITTLCNIGNNITTGGLTIGNSSTMNSDINILVGAGRSVNIPNLVISSLTGVSGNFDVAGSLTAGTTNALLTHQISKIYIQNQTVYAVDTTQPIQFGTTQTTGALNIGSSTNINKVGNITHTGNNIGSSSGTITINPTTCNMNPTTFQLFNNPFRYVPWTVYNNIANSGTVFVKGFTSNPTFNYISSALNGIYSVMGNTLFIEYYFYQASNSGTLLGSGVYMFPLPSGYQIDTTKVVLWSNTGNNQDQASSLGKMCYTWYNNANNTGSVLGFVVSGVSYVVLFLETGAYTGIGGGGGYAGGANLAGLKYSYTAMIPIV